ncbi:hypothetical protein HYR99_06080 [Candidatus Poribacteria bacterium]|nr:hypothetical protein [Candidatus Poribacteria bacterium]
MRKVDYTRFLTGSNFDSWCERAAIARVQLLEAVSRGETLRFHPDIWKTLKDDFLIPGNSGKCMYCEGKYGAGSYGDAEHFRPKGEVTENRKQIIDPPGYYWLAYEWQNILLSCEKCNRPHPDGKGGPHPGKLNEFPIAGTRIKNPHADVSQWWDELVAEEPLLLHPYFDNPEEHFDAGKHGVLYGTTERGKVTIEVCDLDRPALREAREREEEKVLPRLIRSIMLMENDNKFNDARFGAKDEFSTYLNCRDFQIVDRLMEPHRPKRRS